MRGGRELDDGDAEEDERGPEERSATQTLVQEDQPRKPGENRFERKQHNRVSGRQMLLGVALNGERNGGGEDRADDERGYDRRVEVYLRPFEREGENHEDSCAGDLQRRKQARVDSR